MTRMRPLCLAFASCLLLSAGCDKKKEEAPPAEDTRSVAEGAKARTAAGKQVEVAKERIGAAEAKMQARDDAILNAGEASQPRGNAS